MPISATPERRQEAICIVVGSWFEESRQAIPNKPGCRCTEVEVPNEWRSQHPTVKLVFHWTVPEVLLFLHGIELRFLELEHPLATTFTDFVFVYPGNVLRDRNDDVMMLPS